MPLVLESRGLSLAQTLCCGQCFRWEALPGGLWRGVAAGRAVLLWESADGQLLCLGQGGYVPEDEPDFWRRYLALDVDYAALQRVFRAAHPRLGACIDAAPGIRVLRQPFFETLETFLISQNNNIPRIRGIVARLCEAFGTPLGGGLYAFPAAERLAGCREADLACLRAGWRASYLLDAAQRTASGELCESELRAMDTARARALLMQTRGVGPKVADCTLLYGLGHWDAYPVDVWMRRADRALFTGRVHDAGRYLNRRTQNCAGIAQQYIFAWARSGGLAAPPEKDR